MEFARPLVEAVPARASARSSAAAAAREVWQHLPAWQVLLYAFSLLNCALTNLTPPRPEFAPSVVFPLAVFLAYYRARLARLVDREARWRAGLIVAAIAIGLPIANLLWHRPSPLSGATLRWTYELTTFAWALLLGTHAVVRRRGHFVLFYGVGLLYGAFLENGGILLGFFDELHLTFRLPYAPAPLATMIGWSTVIYMCTFVTWELRRRYAWLKRSAAASATVLMLAGLFLDLQIDPMATAAGCWVWDPTLPAAFLGVPFCNFAAWCGALWPFGYVLFRVTDRRQLKDGAAFARADLRAVARALPFAILIAIAIFLSLTLLAEGPHGPSWNILHRTSTRILGAVSP